MSWKDQAERFMDFMSNAPTAYHACDLLAKDFDEAGYKELSERDEWDLTTHNKFYVRRNGSAIMGFVIGDDWTPGNGVGVVATHTDALCGRVKPISIKKPVDGYNLLGVAPYSGAFSSVWWDRDLGIGGRLIVRDEDSKAVTSKLVHVPYPIARIPTLAPHFGAPANPPFNPETQMTPIIGLTSSKDVKEPTDEEKQSPMVGKHSIDLLRLLAKHAGVSVKDIVQVELELFDTQDPVIGGLNHEFIFCPRVDDKLCTYTAVQGFIAAKHDKRALNIVACYDNEEVGSGTRQGAQGDMFQCIVERCVAHGMDSSVANLAAEYTRQTYANSFMVSADVGHAVNPNFSNAYLEFHKPQLNYGMTLKVYPNAATTSDAVSMALIEEIARRTGNKTQVMHTRNDTRAGGTLGKFLASATGMRAVDAGIAQLSMHSIRGTLGSKDIALGTRFFRDFYSTWYEVDQEWANGGI